MSGTLNKNEWQSILWHGFIVGLSAVITVIIDDISKGQTDAYAPVIILILSVIGKTIKNLYQGK